jgi:hypothetical protein
VSISDDGKAVPSSFDCCYGDNPIKVCDSEKWISEFYSSLTIVFRPFIWFSVKVGADSRENLAFFSPEWTTVKEVLEWDTRSDSELTWAIGGCLGVFEYYKRCNFEPELFLIRVWVGRALRGLAARSLDPDLDRDAALSLKFSNFDCMVSRISRRDVKFFAL